jgi:hypothetical protein
VGNFFHHTDKITHLRVSLDDDNVWVGKEIRIVCNLLRDFVKHMFVTTEKILQTTADFHAESLKEIYSAITQNVIGLGGR